MPIVSYNNISPALQITSKLITSFMQTKVVTTCFEATRPQKIVASSNEARPSGHE